MESEFASKTFEFLNILSSNVLGTMMGGIVGQCGSLCSTDLIYIISPWVEVEYVGEEA
jgi:hypothetical protein